MSGQRVYRATDVCFEGSSNASAIRVIETPMKALLLQGSSAFTLLTQVDGELAGVGLARFAIDEQWWLAKPTDELGGAVVLGNNQVSIALDWAGASDEVSEACQREMVDSTQAATDGRLLRGVEFIVDVGDVIKLNRASQGNPAAFACAHLDCAEPLEPTETCVESCMTWRLPLAISFERVEPFDRAEMCAQSVLNPAER